MKIIVQISPNAKEKEKNNFLRGLKQDAQEQNVTHSSSVASVKLLDVYVLRCFIYLVLLVIDIN